MASLFYAVASFLLAEIAAASLSPLAVFDPARYGPLYDISAYLIPGGPILFLFLGVMRAAFGQDRRRVH